MKSSPAKVVLVGNDETGSTRSVRNGLLVLRRCAFWSMWVIVTVLLTSAATAQGSGLRIENVSPHTIESEPLQLVTPTFRVRNETDEQVEVDTEIILPDDWNLVTPVFPLILEAREEKFLFTTVSIPGDAHAGEYTIRVEVETTDFYSVTDWAEVVVHLQAVAKIEVMAPVDHLRVYAEETYTRTFTVINRSNAGSRFVTSVHSNPEWWVTPDPSEFYLDAGGSLEVMVTVKCERIIRQIDHEVVLRVDALDLDNGSVYARGKVITKVYPRKLKGSIYQTLPGEATLLFAGSDDGEFAGQLHIDLNGELGEGRWASVRFSGPYLSNWRGQRFLNEETFLIQYEEEGKGFYSVGDDSLDITPLTERYYHYRGIDFTREDGGRSYRAFYAKQRQGLVPERIYGAQVTLLGDDKSGNELVLTGYSRGELDTPFWQDRGKRHGETVTVMGRAELREGMEVEAEYGLSDYDKGDGRGRVVDSGYRLAGHFVDDGLLFDGEYVFGGDHFPGYWQGITQSKLYLSYLFEPGLVLWGSYASKESDFFGGDEERSKSHIDTRDIGLNASFGGDGNLEISQRWRRNNDTGLNLWDDISKSTNFRLTRQFEGFSLSGMASYDSRRDVLNLTVDGIWKYQFMFNLPDCGNCSFSGGYRWDVDDTELGIESFSNDQLWLNADAKLNDQTKIKTGYTRTTGKDISGITRIKGNIFHDLGRERELELKLEWRSGSYGEEFDIALLLTVPLNVPVPFFPKSGGLEGELWLRDGTGRKKPMAGVIVLVGKFEITTDDRGYFLFPELEDGAYTLSIDRGSLGLDLIADIPQPILVDVKSGSITTLDIPVVKPASVAGLAKMDRGIPKSLSGSAADAQRENPLGGALVIMRNTEEEKRTLTLTDGSFLFEDLRPGHWTIEVADTYVPENYELTPFIFEFDLLPGQVEEGLEFLISPKEREIEITAGILTATEEDEEENEGSFFVEEAG